MKKIKDYIDELNTIDEHVRIEAKQCTDKIDKSVLESICAFSNEPGLDGGVIVVGLQESHDLTCPYKVIGVTDADKLQRDLASQCATMFNHPVRPLIESDVIDGKTVMKVTVSELDSRYKPLYFGKEGLPRGAWRRIGSTDQRCNEEDLSVFYHDTDGFDKVIAEDTDLDDIDENAVRRYRQLREAVNPNAEELNYSDIDLLRSLKAITKDKEGIWRLTNTGLLVFGKPMALRREMPSVRVDYIRVPGTEWVADPHHRFDSIEIGAIDNLSYRQLTGLSSRDASRELKQLEQYGLIMMKGVGRNTYYIPSAKLDALYTVNGGTSASNDATSGSNDGTSASNGGTSGSNGGTSAGFAEIPKSLKDRIDQMGLRVPKEVLTDVIIELCRVRPFSGGELAEILRRTETHIKNKVVPALIETGRLKFTYPEMINHPNQKYTAE